MTYILCFIGGGLFGVLIMALVSAGRNNWNE